VKVKSKTSQSQSQVKVADLTLQLVLHTVENVQHDPLHLFLKAQPEKKTSEQSNIINYFMLSNMSGPFLNHPASNRFIVNLSVSRAEEDSVDYAQVYITTLQLLCLEVVEFCFRTNLYNLSHSARRFRF
jgi:hypothetical protein